MGKKKSKGQSVSGDLKSVSSSAAPNAASSKKAVNEIDDIFSAKPSKTGATSSDPASSTTESGTSKKKRKRNKDETAKEPALVDRQATSTAKEVVDPSVAILASSKSNQGIQHAGAPTTQDEDLFDSRGQKRQFSPTPEIHVV